METEYMRKRIWLIADGVPLRLENMTIRTTDSGKLFVTGWTDTIQFENISRKKIAQELDDLKISFSEFSKSFTELNDLVKLNNLTIEYHMAYDDSGKVGIALCSEIGGITNWYIE